MNRKLLITIHMYLSAFFAPAVLLVAISGGLYLQDLHWRIKPLSLFVGQLRYKIEASPVSGFIDGEVSLNLSGAVTASDLRGSMSLQPFGQLVGIRGLSGTLNVEFERLVIENEMPTAANGVFEVLNLIAPNIHRASIGGYRAEFFKKTFQPF